MFLMRKIPSLMVSMFCSMYFYTLLFFGGNNVEYNCLFLKFQYKSTILLCGAQYSWKENKEKQRIFMKTCALLIVDDTQTKTTKFRFAFSREQYIIAPLKFFQSSSDVWNGKVRCAENVPKIEKKGNKKKHEQNIHEAVFCIKTIKNKWVYNITWSKCV